MSTSLEVLSILLVLSVACNNFFLMHSLGLCLLSAPLVQCV